MLFFYIADAMMSYFSPVAMEAHFDNAFIMGLVLSTSSAVGLATDIIVSRFFPNYDYRFFIKWLIILATLFPLVFLALPSVTLTYFAAMVIWGIYFEFSSFSQFNFIRQNVDVHEHANAWGVVEAFKAMGILIGPVAAGFFLSYSKNLMLFAAITSLMVAGLVFILLKKFAKTRPELVPLNNGRTFKTELKIWKLLLSRIWPVYLFFFALVLVDTAFWTVGPLLSEAIRQKTWLGGFLLPAYIFPSLFAPIIIRKFSRKFSKKRIAFVAAIIGTAIMGGGSFFLGDDNPLLLVAILTGAIFIAIDYPEIEAVFEDYISRVDGYENDLIGLHSSASSFSYIFGPIVAGFTASQIGYSKTLSVFAFFFMFVAIIALIVTPRKIRMDLKGLEEIAAAKPPTP